MAEPNLQPVPIDARGRRVAVIVSRYNAGVTGPMLEGAVRTFTEAGGQEDDAAVFEAAGTFELPALAARALDAGFEAAVCLGCLIRGETRHDEVIAHAAARALADLSARERAPVAFGVLTVADEAQARARAGGERGNKGEEAMRAALETLATMTRIDASKGGADVART